jgi:hypothetical protein
MNANMNERSENHLAIHIAASRVSHVRHASNSHPWTATSIGLLLRPVRDKQVPFLPATS